METSIKFPDGYYCKQAAIQMLHKILLPQSCHYIRPSPIISSSNQWIVFLNNGHTENKWNEMGILNSRGYPLKIPVKGLILSQVGWNLQFYYK